jgi:hypothetical protein
MQTDTIMRNPIAKNAWKFNKPKAYRAKKGKGSFKRVKKEKHID